MPGPRADVDDLADVRGYRPPAATPDPDRRFAIRPGDRRAGLSGPTAFRVGTWAHGIALLVLGLGMLTVLGLDPAAAIVYTIMAAIVGAPAALGVGTLVSWLLAKALRRVPWLAVHLLSFAVAGGAVGGIGLITFFAFDLQGVGELLPVGIVAAGLGAGAARAVVERQHPTQLR